MILPGNARMRPLHTIAIAQPAIAGKSIYRHTAEYYTQPMETLPDIWVYAVGYARDPALASGHPPAAAPAAAIGRLHPESQPGIYGLTHVLLLNDAPSDATQGPAGASIVSIAQLVGNSVFIEGELRLYPMYHAAACVEALVRP